MKKTLKELKDIAEKYDYVSFDIFDTLMFRTVPHYTNLYGLMQKKYEDLFEPLKRDFKKDRIRAEAKARRSVYPNEVTLDYIYSFLPYGKDICNRMESIEIWSEIKCCVPNPPMIEFLNWCRGEHKRIIIISDMYHSRETLNAILMKLNVKYDRLFISCEEGVTKRSGDLFNIVLERLNIKPMELMHVGDDLNNDIAKPSAIGITAVERAMDVENFGDVQGMTEIEKHIQSIYSLSTEEADASALHRFAYCVLGPMCVDFCQWIHKKAEQLEIERILFVAREGYLLKECYERLYPEDLDRIGYVRLNKNLLRLPLMNSENPVEEFLRSIPSRLVLTWDEVLKNLFVQDVEGLKKIIANKFHDFDVEKNFSPDVFRVSSVERSVLEFAIGFQRDNIKKQYQLLDAYLTQIGIYEKRVALVNNSINGSGQSMIEQYAKSSGRQCDIVGLQIVKSAICKKRLENRCLAWISDSQLPYSYTYFYGSSNLIIEHLLFESVGTALYFYLNDGKVDVVCEDQKSEKWNNSLLLQVQSRVLSFVSEYYDGLNLKIDFVGAQMFKKWLENPDKETARLFCEMYDEDNDGEKKLADLSIDVPKYVALKRYIPNDIKWYPGYFSAKGLNKFWLFLYNLRYVLKYSLKKY